MNHYNKKYFDWQNRIGKFGGKADLFKFSDFINPNDKVIDFGSGAGQLLSNINCKDKIGIEINSVAREESKRNGIKAVESADDIDDEWANVIISHHALEHTERPLDVLKLLFKKLKTNGTIVLVVPYERKNKYKPEDVNQHLYTWSEMNIGNLFVRAGFKVIKVEELIHRWPKKFELLRKVFGATGFNFISKINGLINHDISQIRIVAEK